MASYRWDIFISYAHVDGKWVERFHQDLEQHLRSKVDPKIRIWHDQHQLRTGDALDRRLAEDVRASAILIPVISAAWKGSAYCQRELEEFVNGGAVDGRILPVEIAAVKDLPVAIEPLVRQPFYGGRTQLRFRPGTRSYEGAISSLAMASAKSLEKARATDVNTDIDPLVKQLREKVRPSIQERCGTMRVLSMSQPIKIGGIYTDVNILEKITGRQRKTLEELVACTDREQFDRFGIGLGKVERISGLDAVGRHSKLIIYGKPGAGKTTFLRRLAMECADGRFRPDLVPAFVPLREFSEVNEERAIADHILKNWGAVAKADEVLKAGRALVLLDGLDEVPDRDHTRVRKCIEQFAADYSASTMVITCRIAAREYLFEHFTEVEMADFDETQIAQFAKNWFVAKNDPPKGDLFLAKLKNNPPIRELASSPLLCTLLCLIFEERTDFDGDRAELYREGLDVLLKTWDGKRSIERDRPYRKLTAARREDLLAEIAHSRFERGEYLFRQDALEREIQGFFETRENLIEPGEEFDAGKVLQAIEAQHGLLVARAQRVYSFSHLTFQEYLTARKIAQSAELLRQVGTHFGDDRWKEVFLLIVGMASADELLMQWKDGIDETVANDATIQDLLRWTETKALKVESPYQTAAVRAFYCSIDLALTITITLTLDLALALDRALGLDLDYVLARNSTLDHDHAGNLGLDLALAVARTRSIDLTLALHFERTRSIDLTLALHLALDIALDNARVRHAVDLVSGLDGLKQQLRDTVPDRGWWSNNGKKWSVELRHLMTQHRDIGYDWNFEPKQVQMLDHYFRHNRFLLACMNAARDLKKSTREWIESTMLLPMESIRRMESKRAAAKRVE